MLFVYYALRSRILLYHQGFSQCQNLNQFYERLLKSYYINLNGLWAIAAHITTDSKGVNVTVHPTALNWIDAEQYCLDQGATLYIPDDEAHLESL